MDTNNGAMNAYFIPVAVVLAGLFIGGAVIWNGAHPSGTTTTTTQSNGTDKAWLEKITTSIPGIDISKVEAAVTANKIAYDTAITADHAEAQASNIGINATPSMLVGTQLIAGAYPFSDLDLVIKAALKGTVDKTAAGGQVQIVQQDSSKVNTVGEPFIGSVTAPVTLAYWSDYQCPFCQRFEEQTLPTIIQTYVNTGKVKVVFKDFPFLGPASLVDAEYARAVWALYPDKFFAWRTAIFTNQQPENSLSV
jgi:protein-disulfide isomerase